MNTTAIILELISQNDYIPGRVVLQKLVYFTKISGGMSSPWFRLHIYGPFSKDVSSTLQDCVAGMILEEDGGIVKSVEFENACREYNDGMISIRACVTDVLNRFKGESRGSLELLSTTHFIYSQQRNLYKEEYDRRQICRKVEQVKGTRFSKKEIEAAYQKLCDLNLISIST